jgi:Lysozyme like domain
MRRLTIAAAAAGVLLYAGTQHGGTAATTAITAGMAPSGGTLSCSGLESLWESAGGSPSAAFMAAEIAMAESSGQQNSADSNSNGTVDRGYWQINSTWGALSTFDPEGNARAAVQISHNGTNWGLG